MAFVASRVKYPSRVIVVFNRRIPTVIVAMIAATLLTSIVAAVDSRSGGALYERLALVPMRVWHGEVWRLVTWAMVETGPLSLIWACVAYYWFGGWLVAVWGSRRFLRYIAAVVLIAGAGTTLAGMVLPMVWWLPHLGSFALESAVIVAWGLTFPERRVRVYHVLEISGQTLAYGTVGLVVLIALFFGIAYTLPMLIAVAVALAAMQRRRG